MPRRRRARLSRSRSADPGSRPGTCPSSSPAPSTSGCWSTSAPSAARLSGNDGTAAPCCPRCWHPGCIPPSAARRLPRTGDGTQPAAGPGSTRTAGAARPAPAWLLFRTRSSASLIRAAPLPRSAPECLAPPASYFSDLRALALLACSTWPAARHLSPDEDAASAIDQHIDSLRKQAAAGMPDLRRTHPAPGSTSASPRRTPQPAAA